MAKKEFRYYNKGIERKKQIYSWTTRILKQMGDYYEIANELLKGNLEIAYSIFENAINRIIIYNTDNLGYLIEKNQAEYGEKAVNNDLFSHIFGDNAPKKQKEKGEGGPVAPPEVKRYYYGTTKGKRQKGRYEIVFIKGRANDRLRSVKTGRFLKMSDRLKSKIDKRGQIKSESEV
jgi:hypothetical protein